MQGLGSVQNIGIFCAQQPPPGTDNLETVQNVSAMMLYPLYDCLCGIGYRVRYHRDQSQCAGDDITFWFPWNELQRPPHSPFIAIVQTEHIAAPWVREKFVPMSKDSCVVVEMLPEYTELTARLTGKITIPWYLGYDKRFDNQESDVECPTDVFMLQHATSYRKAILDRVQGATVYDGPPVWDTPTIASYSRTAKICLNLHHCAEATALETSRVILRFMANGGFVLSQRSSHPYLRNGEHLIYFDGADDMVRKLRYYLDHQAEARSIADRAYCHVRDHIQFSAGVKDMMHNIEGVWQSL